MKIGLACVALILALSAFAAHAQTATPALFAFVLLGEGTDGAPVPMVRSVEEGGKVCPTLFGANGAALGSMTPRQRPSGGGFDNVMVCEARYPVGEGASVRAAGRRIDLPVVSLGTPRRVVLLGDSGCFGPHQRKPQSCVGDGYDKMWPFGTISAEGAKDGPDLIIHVGDYNYRGTPRDIVLPPSATGYARDLKVKVFDTGDLDDDEEPDVPIGPAYFSQNMPGSPTPDIWANWRDDFFVPSPRLLVAAPWVLSRGNHELCSRAGPGWFYLLDAASPLLGPGRRQAECPPQLPAGWRPGAWPAPPAQPFLGESFPTAPHPPFRLRLGGLDIIAVDSSDAGDAEIYAFQHYVEVYRAVGALLAEIGRPAWLVTHRPIWGVVRREKGRPAGSAPYGFVNTTQQAALATALPSGLPANVAAVFGGHMHRFQATAFAGRRPPQVVVGTGGMELSQTVPVPPMYEPRQPIRVPDLTGLDGYTVGLSDFGLMVLTVGDGGAWTGTLHGTSGQVLATCDSRWAGETAARRSVCALQ
jgi:hypothetical protein